MEQIEKKFDEKGWNDSLNTNFYYLSKNIIAL
jgi:hypothetical protein